MNKLRVNRQHFSKLFWNIVLQNEEEFLHNGWPELRRELLALETRRTQADYNTGSINLSAAFCLYALCRYLGPTTVAEVGTFIGKSTLAMAKAMEPNASAVLHTCDFSNAIELQLPTTTKIVQYQRQSSTQMFEALKADGARVDLFALDGRLTREDLPTLAPICQPNAVFALDDFEGVEKGVANAMLLTGSGLLKNHVLIYPAMLDLLSDYGFRGGCTTAVLLPASLIAYTAQ